MLKKDAKNWLKKINHLKDVDTPVLIIDLMRVKDQIKLFRDEFPECQVYYAIKSLGDQKLLDAIEPFVDGFDVASFGEGNQALSAGASPQQVLFSNPVKKPEHIAKLSECGVHKFAFDSINELTKLAQIAPGSDVYLRMKVDDHGSAFPLSSKFGASPSHVVALMDMAVELGLKPKGITFHVGSQSENLHAWEVALELCGKAMVRLQKVGIKIDFINLGGGFPVRYTEAVPSFKKVVSTIRSAMQDHFPYDVQLKAEPGRFITAEAGLMLTTVIGREHRAGTDWLFTDIGSFNGLIEPLEMPGWKYPIYSDAGLVSDDTLLKHFTLTGPTCDPSDTFAHDVPLPANITVGDRLYIGSAGAYTVVYSSNFNGFEQPKVHYINESTNERVAK